MTNWIVFHSVGKEKLEAPDVHRALGPSCHSQRQAGHPPGRLRVSSGQSGREWLWRGRQEPKQGPLGTPRPSKGSGSFPGAPGIHGQTRMEVPGAQHCPHWMQALSFLQTLVHESRHPQLQTADSQLCSDPHTSRSARPLKP